jgi:hypothetical protein
VADGGRPQQAPRRPIVGFHTDDEGHWVADLECGHGQHVRHNPPWQMRPWVLTPEGRASFLGVELRCAKCLAGESSRALGQFAEDAVKGNTDK